MTTPWSCTISDPHGAGPGRTETRARAVGDHAGESQHAAMIVDRAATCVDGEIVAEAYRAGLKLKRAAVIKRDGAGADGVGVRHPRGAR